MEACVVENAAVFEEEVFGAGSASQLRCIWQVLHYRSVSSLRAMAQRSPLWLSPNAGGLPCPQGPAGESVGQAGPVAGLNPGGRRVCRWAVCAPGLEVGPTHSTSGSGHGPAWDQPESH